jgi:predicted enzyme related to lactoylglutathione lyase
MTDPLDVLATPVEPVPPSEAFAARLRARIERALSLPEGVAVSEPTLTETRPGPTEFPRPGALPYLSVRDARSAIEWYEHAFGATLVGEPYVMPDGRVGHAELAVGGGTIYLAEEFPEMGLRAPAGDATAVSLMLPVDDTDATLERVRVAGGRIEREPYEEYGQRNASLVDPYGHRWMLAGPMRTEAPAEAEPIRHGDIGYVSVNVPDVDRARAFYGAVLGWQFGPDGRRVTNASMPQGLWGEEGTPTLFCAYAVDSVDAAVAAVRAAGGTASEPEERPYGRVSDCVDDQGMAFAVYEPRSGSERPPTNGARHGDVAYLTFEVADSGRARAFYGAVLGWRFEPGRIEDGWGVVDVAPMVGMAGGGAGVVTPMWLVEDIGAAVGRVREAGGTATDPERRPYATTAECTDDQGTRFWLGEV